ncbi:MAG: prepilin-type N-terminal cleavage/methylation domain-containing protein [Planctomycetota bacterium]|nr:prepilin-type N-terminal cleavage/methylation domain-containing protein [Planctomycetota bacterium]
MFSPRLENKIAIRVHGAYTLIELLVVISIMAILTGIGIAGITALTRKSELQAQTQLVRSMLRKARNTAREERFPAIVRFDYQNNEIHAQTRKTLAFFRFETDMTPPPLDGDSEGGDGDLELPPEESGDEAAALELVGALNVTAKGYHVDFVDGQIGTALVFGEPLDATTFEDFRTAPASYVEVEERPSLSPVEGVFIEAWVQPELLIKKLTRGSNDGLETSVPSREDEDKPFREAPSRTPPDSSEVVDIPLFTIVRKGKAYEMALTYDLGIEVTLTGPNKDGDEVTYVGRSQPDIVKELKWTRVGVAFDGDSVTLLINGLQRGLFAISDEHAVIPQRLSTTTGPLRISDNNPRRAFFGRIDEVRVSGLIRGDTVKIPRNITLIPGEEVIRFDALGQLDPLSHAESVSIQLSDDPELLDKLYPEEDRKNSTKTVVRSKDNSDELKKEAKEFRRYLRKARRLIKAVSARNRREVIVDMHGTLR